MNLTLRSQASKVLEDSSPLSLRKRFFRVIQKGFAMEPEQRSEGLTDSERRKDGIPLWKRIGGYALIFVIGFLLGLVPMWLTARQRAQEIDATRAQLRQSQLRSALSGAALDARRADYEPARQSMSDFFGALSAELNRGENSVFDQTQREAVRPLLGQRDEIITLLARSDPAAADKLSNLDADYRKATGNAQALSPPS